MDGPTDGRTHPLIEMRELIKRFKMHKKRDRRKGKEKEKNEKRNRKLMRMRERQTNGNDKKIKGKKKERKKGSKIESKSDRVQISDAFWPTARIFVSESSFT